MSEVRLIRGGLHRDARGVVRFANDFDFKGVDRFYSVHPARSGEVRGWVGHLRDWKWFFVVAGAFDVGVVAPKNWSAPDKGAPVTGFRLTAGAPAVLEVPPGHYFASKAVTEGAILLVFSSGQIETAGEDDFRLATDYWEMPLTAESEPCAS